VTRADTRTPGPWRAHGFVVATGTGYSRAVIARMERLGETSLLIGPGEAHANARAIAELPALVEAARALVAYWEDDDSSEDQLDEAVATASAALARMDWGDDA
jgi:hypothetical protein